MQFRELVAVSDAVASTRSRLQKVGRLAVLLRQTSDDELPLAVAFLAGEMLQGRIGLGESAVRKALAARAAIVRDPDDAPSLRDVDQVLADIAEVRGPGANARRGQLLGRLLASMSAAEQDFLARLIMGNVRHGALEGILVEAVAQATKTPVAAVRRAVMLAGSLPAVALTARREGNAGVARYGLELFRPVQPMLAETAEDHQHALSELGLAVLEYKLDGVRIQIHKSGDDVRIYTRRLKEITDRVPEIVEQASRFAARDLILDGEVLALRPDGRPQPFQTTMRRLGRKSDVAALRASHPLSASLFDCLQINGESLIDRGTSTRHAALDEIVGVGLCVPRLATRSAAAAGAFLEQAIAAGHEGIMAKSADAPYEAGGRGKYWLKIKPWHTLDLAILAAEWGSGRRKGYLSNLHLGARDASADEFAMVGKTFKGLTDAMLAEQTEALLQLEIARDQQTVFVDPRLVVEVAFDEVQQSPRYPTGYALRFARVKRHRFDKPASQCDELSSIEQIFRKSRE